MCVKSEWIEQEREEERLYGKSLLHIEDEEYDSMKDYEFSICHRDDDVYYHNYDDGGIHHFGE